MKIIYPAAVASLPPLAASIGFFDGVHPGHRFLIGQLTELAHQTGLHSAVITFRDHPRKRIDPTFSPALINTFDEKMYLLAQTGVEYCIVLDFTTQLQELTASEFLQQTLRHTLNIHALLIGYDHRFGKNRSEQFEDYYRYGLQCGMQVVSAKKYAFDTLPYSSSSIRSALLSNQIEVANQLLGHPYTLQGTVVRGLQLGRTIGFPTANIRSEDADKLIPANGVYVVRVTLISTPPCIPTANKHNTYGAMLNIGYRPTVCKEKQISIEAHLFDYRGDLYDCQLEIQFIAFLRYERKMDSLTDLRAQLEIDRSNSLKKLKAATQ